MNRSPRWALLSTAALACATTIAAPLDLSGAQVSVKDGSTLSIVGASGAGGKGEQRFRWDANSESFVRTGLKNEAYCSTGPFRDSTRSDWSFSLSITSSLNDRTLILTLERIQGYPNFPVGVQGFTLYQGKKWFLVDENAGARGSSLYARRIEPAGDAPYLLPVGGRAVYRVDNVPHALDLGAPITAVAKENARFECLPMDLSH